MSPPSPKRQPPLEFDIPRNAMDGDVQRVASTGSTRSQAAPSALPSTQLQVATYIEELSLELRTLALAARLDSLAYFIDMTRVEAENTRLHCEAQLGRSTHPRS